MSGMQQRKHAININLYLTVGVMIVAQDSTAGSRISIQGTGFCSNCFLAQHRHGEGRLSCPI